MSSSSQNILREYLVALGFKVNTTEHKRMESSVQNLDKKLTKLGKVAITTATAVVGFVMLYARQMEKLYYASRYADSTAEKLQELEFGAQQVGLQAGQMTGAMKNFAASIRSNPGLIGLLNSMGIEVKGRDKADVMMDFVKALKGMPFYVAQRFAQMFGMDAETLFNLEKGSEEMAKQKEIRRQMAEEMGVDTNAAAEASVQLLNDWRHLEMVGGLFGQGVLQAAQGPMRELMAVTEMVLKDWLVIIRAIKEYGADDFFKRISEGLGISDPGGTRATLTADTKARLGDDGLPYHAPEGNIGLGKGLEKLERWFLTRHGKLVTQRGMDPLAVDAATDPSGADLNPGMSETERVARTNAYLKGAPSATSGAQALFAKLEAKYHLPPGILDRMWNAESGRGQKMLSPKGAKGHFGFMDATAKEFGLKDPNNLEESANAAARKMSGLLRMYDGDPRQAAAAYNWGQGNLTDYQLGTKAMPDETKGYMDKVAPVTVNQTTNIHVTGTDDPKATATAVADEQQRVNGDITRNFQPRVR